MAPNPKKSSFQSTTLKGVLTATNEWSDVRLQLGSTTSRMKVTLCGLGSCIGGALTANASHLLQRLFFFINKGIHPQMLQPTQS